MSYDDLKKEPGKERIDVLVLTLDRCTLTNGVAPCNATRPCSYTWATCASRDDYDSEPFELTFCTPASYTPPGAIPFLESVSYSAGVPDPENGLGKRASVTFNFIDAPHDDIGIDPEAGTRGYDALTRGTFWPKFRARWPYYQGRPADWYTGFVHYPFDLANMKKRSFIGSELKGWGRGNSQLVAKDPLTLADNDKAEYPPRSTGRLVAAMDISAPITQFDIETERLTEYDIQSWEPFGVVRIGDMCIKYTTVTTITGGVRLSGLTFAQFDSYVTALENQDIGAEVQKCAYFYQMRPIDVFVVQLEDGAGIDSAYIPYSEWLDEASTWIAGFRLTRLVTQPEGVKATLSELIPQTSTWALWWDDEASLIRYRVVRPADVDEVVDSFNDDQHIIAGSVELRDEPEQLLNEVYVAIGQRDPTKKIDELGNYRDGFVTIRVDSQSDRESGQRKIKNIFGRWHPTGNRAELIGLVDRMLSQRSFIPVRVDFEVERKDDSVKTAQFLDLTTYAILDGFGAVRENVRVRVLAAKSGSDNLSLVAREELFSPNFGRWAPADIPAGTEWSDATDEQRQKYIFWSDADGNFSDGTTGKAWL